MVARADRRCSSARFNGALRVGLAVLACWAFNACGLNPRPEDSAADKGGIPNPPNMMGGTGGASSSPGSASGGAPFSGAGGGGPSAPGVDGGGAIIGPDSGADAADGSSPEASDDSVVD